MKTKLKSNPEKKAKMIKMLAEAIDKNTDDEHEVYQFVHALKNGFDFLSDSRWCLRSDSLTIIRYIEDELKRSAWLKSFQEISETASEALLIANQNYEGIEVVCSMSEDFEAISETYGE